MTNKASYRLLAVIATAISILALSGCQKTQSTSPASTLSAGDNAAPVNSAEAQTLDVASSASIATVSEPGSATSTLQAKSTDAEYWAASLADADCVLQTFHMALSQLPNTNDIDFAETDVQVLVRRLTALDPSSMGEREAVSLGHIPPDQVFRDPSFSAAMKLAQYSDRAKAVGVICHKYLERNSRYQQLMANMRDIPNSASAQKPEETTAAAAAATAAAANAAKDAQAAATDFQKQVDTLKSGMSSNQGSESPAEETAEAQTARVPDASASQSTAQEKPSSTSRGCHNTVECAKAMLNDARTEDLPAAMSAADAIDSFPRAPRGDRVSARRLNQQGLSALHAGHAEDAVNLLTQAVQADRGDQEIAANLAYAYAANGEFAKSEDTAVQALALNPRRTSVWAPLAETLAKEHRPDQAIEAMWLAYQFSSDKQKTFSFIDSKVATEKDPDALKMYAASKSWFEKNEKPSVLR